MAILWILLFLFVFISLLLFLPMQFGMHYVKTTNKKKILLYLSLFGMLIPIPIHTKRDKVDAKERKKARKKQKENKVFSFENFKESVENLKDIYTVSKKELLELLSYVRKHLSCKELDIRVAFGFDNAATTGITTGAVWTTGTLLLKIIDSLIGIKKMHMDVYPDFDHKRFEIGFKVIFVIQPFRFFKMYQSIKRTTKYIKSKQIKNTR